MEEKLIRITAIIHLVIGVIFCGLSLIIIFFGLIFAGFAGFAWGDSDALFVIAFSVLPLALSLLMVISSRRLFSYKNWARIVLIIYNILIALVGSFMTAKYPVFGILLIIISILLVISLFKIKFKKFETQ